MGQMYRSNRLWNSTSDPGSPADGDLFYRSDTDKLRLRANGAWAYLLDEGRQVISGSGLTGGGALSGDLTLAVGAGTGITVNADDVAVNKAVIMPVPLIGQTTSDTATINSTTLVNCVSVTLTETGTYYFHALIPWVGNGTAATPGFNLQGSATTSAFRWVARTIASSAIGGGKSNGTVIPSSTSGVAVGAIGTSTNEHSTHITGTFTATATGTIIMGMSRTAGSGTYIGGANATLLVMRSGA